MARPRILARALGARRIGSTGDPEEGSPWMPHSKNPPMPVAQSGPQPGYSADQVRGRYVGFVLVARQPGWIPAQLVQTTVVGWGAFWPFWPVPTSWMVNSGNHPLFQCPGPNPSCSFLVVTFYRVIILQYCYSSG